MQGTVTNKSSRKVNTKFGEKDTYSVNIDGQWYGNGFKPLPEINEGDQVDFDFTTNGQYKNLKYITKTGGSSAPSQGGNAAPSPKQNDIQKAIIRQNALAHATNVAIATKTAKESDESLVKRIIRLAPVFVSYADGTIEEAVEANATDAILGNQ